MVRKSKYKCRNCGTFVELSEGLLEKLESVGSEILSELNNKVQISDFISGLTILDDTIECCDNPSYWMDE